MPSFTRAVASGRSRAAGNWPRIALAIVLTASTAMATPAPAAAAVPDATTTTLVITPPGGGYANQPVTFDVTVTSTSGAIPTGFVAIQTAGVCGAGGPTASATLDAQGTARMTRTFPASDYAFQACYFGDADDTFGESESGSQLYPIVVAPPVMTKAFGDATIPLGGTTTLSFSITNQASTIPQTGIGFTDTLPDGLVVAASPNLNNQCGGTATAAAGSSSVSLASVTLADNASCSLSVAVTGTAAGVKTNTVAASSTEGGAGGTATAAITVVAPPTIAKVFRPAALLAGATTALEFTIVNPTANTVALTGVGFTDALPNGLAVASASTAVCGGTLTTSPETGIALAGATIPAGGQCEFSVPVRGTSVGTYTNTTSAVSSANGGSGNAASAVVSVLAPPIPLLVLVKTADQASIAAGATVVYRYTLTNPGNVALGSVSVTDDRCSPVTRVSGDANGDEFLQPDETWVYRCEMRLSETTTNVATATASFPGGTLATTASLSITVAPPPAPSPTLIPVRLTDRIAAGVNRGTFGFGTASVVVRPGSYVTVLVDTDPSLAGRLIVFWTRTRTGDWEPLTSRLVAADGTARLFRRISAWTGIWARFAGDSVYAPADAHGRIATAR